MFRQQLYFEINKNLSKGKYIIDSNMYDTNQNTNMMLILSVAACAYMYHTTGQL